MRGRSPPPVVGRCGLLVASSVPDQGGGGALSVLLTTGTLSLEERGGRGGLRAQTQKSFLVRRIGEAGRVDPHLLQYFRMEETKSST